MFYRRGWVQTLSPYKFKGILEDAGLKDPDVYKVMNIIFDDDDVRCCTYQLVDNSWIEKKDATFLQRLNRLWIVPLYMLTVPFQWLFRGKVGFNNESKIAAVFVKLTGLE
ncbi:hypothetical protein [Yersinia phage PY54]|uniref:hypothetical protein n=1 Tax=Yersinia phage PY54 TaxID=172667 RepID=UPI00001B984E|nr:hypothetical protein PY54p33 [Yersinia phage PY54]EKN3944421.1 hypothetical protein [Yersinia enterocolitica]CAD91794.1 hypothetical protein [Yersinia phage PY54]